MSADVVTAWIGHSVKVQNDSYAQVDDHRFGQFSDMQLKLVATKAYETVTTPEKQVAI